MLFQEIGIFDAVRYFDYDYIYFDFIFLISWVVWLIKDKRYTSLTAGLVFGLLSFFIDAVVWWNTPAGEGYPLGTFVREYWIGSEQVPHQFGILYLQKLSADFMMTISYGLFAFTWVWLLFEYWKSKISLKKIIQYTIYWITAWVAIPWLSTLISWNDVVVHSVRHMDSQFLAWVVNIIAGYILLSIIACSGRFGKKEPKRKILHIFLMGIFVAFLMEFPLFVFGIRPVNFSFLVYETVFLFNQGAPYLWIMSERLFPYIKGFRN